MVLRYEAAGGTPVQQRDARLAHRIVIPAADKAAGLAKMAPQVFSLDAAGDLLWDFWKCFHQSHYRPFEVTATAVLVPCLNDECCGFRTMSIN